MKMIKKQLLKVYNNWIRISDSINVGSYTTWRTLNYSQRKKSDAETLTSLSVSTHIVEKGLTMPQRSLGFGLPRINAMVEMLLSNTHLMENQQYQSALAVLQEYEALHNNQNYDIPKETAEGFTKLKLFFKGQYFTPQYEFTRDEFFGKKSSDFQAFAHGRHSLRNLTEAAPVDDIVKAIDLAKTAPSACNRQATKVHVYSDYAKVQQILNLQNGNRGFGHLVRQVLLITFDTRMLGLREQNDGFTNAGMFTMNLSYALHYYSIGSCILNWSVTAAKDKKMRKVSDIPDNETIALVMIVGIPPKTFMVAKSERKETSKYYTIHSPKVIGILTFHRATNFGALLQAYALQQVIKGLGYDVEIVDYRCGQVGKIFLSLNVPTLIRKLRRIAYNFCILPLYPFKRKRRNTYTNFSDKYLNLSEKNFNLTDEKWGCFIMGSDQVWNIRLTDGFDRYFYGDFPVTKGTKKIGYAVSASENLQESMSNPQCLKALTNFDAIGCREAELLSIVEDKVECTTALVLDPTLLGGKDIFNDIVSKKLKSTKPYLLIYQMNTSKDAEIMTLSRTISDQKGWDIREIPSSLCFKKWLFRKGWSQWTTPVEFVDLFRNAEFVITTSFHGVAFSLMFNKPFYLYSISKTIDARASFLLRNVHLMDRIIYSIEEADIDNLYSINWEEANSLLSKLRMDSLLFLKKYIKD